MIPSTHDPCVSSSIQKISWNFTKFLWNMPNQTTSLIWNWMNGAQQRSCKQIIVNWVCLHSTTLLALCVCSLWVCVSSQEQRYYNYHSWCMEFSSQIFNFHNIRIGVAPKTLCTIFMILLTLWNSELKNGLIVKLFCFSSDFDETWWSCSYPCVLLFHQVSSKSDEKQKSFINSQFFYSEFQSVSRIVKIVHPP